ncbi:hypothetical protein [Streptomyces stackebrandtii]|uniref:hypothetical protein n=1 Tax=Streptomyces stackebrandtii TaxID=3051177 RepID=UPI0028DB3734|nr:hypothetical protein [Streptomyces sp. DSM 40976]
MPTPPEKPRLGEPSRALRLRAADGWERFMRGGRDQAGREETLHAGGPDGYEQHPLLNTLVRDVASRGVGRLTAVTHELQESGRPVRLAHIRPASGIEWTTAADNIRPMPAEPDAAS